MTPQTKSLPALTDFGMQVSRQLRAEEWAKQRAISLLGEQQHLEQVPESEDDHFCEKYIRDVLTGELKRKIGEFARNHGIGEEDVAVVLRIELRDAIQLVRAGARLRSCYEAKLA